MTRADTLLLALLVLNVLLGAICLAVARRDRDSRALRLWGWGQMVYAAGLLITLSAFVPDALRKIVGNALIACAPILTVEGALDYTTVRLNRRWVAGAWVVAVAPLVLTHLGPRDVVIWDIVTPAIVAIALFGIAAVVLLRQPPPDARLAGRFVGGIFLYDVLVWSLRMAFVWRSIGGADARERDLTIAMFGIAQMVAAIASTLGLLWIEVRNMEAELRRMADTDALTGLPNRRATVARFGAEIARAARRGRSFGLLLVDIDHFKQINDSRGHQAGDRALQGLAAVLRDASRGVDVVGRVGGEEFVVVLSEEPLEGALAAAERLRARVAASTVGYDHSALTLTVSGGLAMYPADGGSWDELFAAADRRLYESKAGGRNRITGPAKP